MLKTVIIEDEKNTLEALKKLLQILMPTIQIVGETGYVTDAIHLIEKHKPDVIFLDIELEDGNGFDILNRLENIDFKIIFTTAYNNFAIKAFKFSTVDYLLKPIDPLELKTALTKVTEQLDTEKDYKQLLSTLKNNINKEEPKIVIKTSDESHILMIKDIIRLEADGAYTTFVTTDKKIIISKNLKYYQDLLTDSFIRCHQSHLVNTNHITSIKNKTNLWMTNGDLIPISTRKITEIRKIINSI